MFVFAQKFYVNCSCNRVIVSSQFVIFPVLFHWCKLSFKNSFRVNTSTRSLFSFRKLHNRVFISVVKTQRFKSKDLFPFRGTMRYSTHFPARTSRKHSYIFFCSLRKNMTSTYLTRMPGCRVTVGKLTIVHFCTE